MFWITENKKINKWKKSPVFNTETMLPISEIQSDALILKDWWLRSIIKISGLNIDLKNWDEIQVIFEQYKKFLWWLTFPVQILVRNNNLDLTPYVDYLKNNMSYITNPQLKKQSDYYLDFLKQINSKQNHIFMKEFYIIIPLYTGMQTDLDGVNPPRWQKLIDTLSTKFGAEQIVAKYRGYLKNKKQLDTRCNMIMDGLRGLHMEVERLKMIDIVSLLFKCYNPTLQQSQAKLEE